MVYDPNLNPGINWKGLYEGRDTNGNPIPQGERERNLIYEYNQRAKAQNLPEIPYTARNGIPQYIPVKEYNPNAAPHIYNPIANFGRLMNSGPGGKYNGMDGFNEQMDEYEDTIDKYHNRKGAIQGLNLPVELQNINPSGLVALEQYLRGDLA